MNTLSQDIINRLRALRPELEAMGIERLRVFGSVARGEAGPESDVDLLVRFREEPSLLRFYGIRNAIQDALGRKVDLLTPEVVHKALKGRIHAEARDV